MRSLLPAGLERQLPAERHTPYRRGERADEIFCRRYRPLSPALKEIPSLEFSFWNPEEGRYVSLRSQPIPIAVYPANTPYSQALQDSALKKAPAAEETLPADDSARWPAVRSEPEPVEISSNQPLAGSDLRALILAVLGCFYWLYWC